MNKIKPISPNKIEQYIPDFVIQAANECIQYHYKAATKSSHFTQNELIKYILKHISKDKDITRDTLFRNNWLDIEPIYRKQGWEVEYDQPGYCESYAANFTFTHK